MAHMFIVENATPTSSMDQIVATDLDSQDQCVFCKLQLRIVRKWHLVNCCSPETSAVDVTRNLRFSSGFLTNDLWFTDCHHQVARE